MNKLDTVYYDAIASANEGTVSAEALKVLGSNASKFALIDETGESVRFYERIFSIWKTIKAHPDASLSPDAKAVFKFALTEYDQLLTKLKRDERAQEVRLAIREVSCSN